MIDPLLHHAVKLAHRDDRDLELPSQRFQSATDLGDLFLPAVTRILGADELDVVNKNEINSLVKFKALARAVMSNMVRIAASSRKSWPRLVSSLYALARLCVAR